MRINRRKLKRVGESLTRAFAGQGLRTVIIAAAVANVGLGTTALAYTQQQLHTEYAGTVFYDPLDDCGSTADTTTTFGPGDLPSYIKAPYNAIFTAAAKKYDTDPAVLVAIFYDENYGYQNAVASFKAHAYRNPPPPYGSGPPWPVSSANARGPFQFIPSTYAGYMIVANGHPPADPNDLTDESFSAASYLHDIGASNPVSVAKVQKAAASYYGAPGQYSDAAGQIFQLVKQDEGAGAAIGATGNSASVGGCCQGQASSAPSTNNGVSFNDSQSTDTNKQTVVDDDGIDPSPTGSPNHQSSTSYANGKLSALRTNYIALNPGWASANGLVLGDVAAVTYQGKTVYAVYGDNHVGNTPHAEISVFTVMALTGVGAVAADTTSLQGVSFVVYKGTHTQLNGSVDQAQIDKIGASSASTGGPGPTCTSTASIDCYKNPLRDQKPLAPARIDEGVDYLAAGPIYALGQGHVDYVNAGSGWPGGTFIGYVLDCGPAQGKRVYVAEHLVNIGVHVGQKVDSNTRLADEVDSSPYDETGWALPASDFNGTPVDLAAAYQIYTPDGTATAYGDNFDDLMVKLGAPHGTYQFSNQSGGKNLTGTLPAGWPKWK